MILKNLLLLEYMVIKRIEKDTIRLEAIRSVSQLLTKGEIDIDNLSDENKINLFKELVRIKGKSLSYAETELIEEIITITK